MNPYEQLLFDFMEENDIPYHFLKSEEGWAVADLYDVPDPDFLDFYTTPAEVIGVLDDYIRSCVAAPIEEALREQDLYDDSICPDEPEEYYEALYTCAKDKTLPGCENLVAFLDMLCHHTDEIDLNNLHPLSFNEDFGIWEPQ